MELGFRPNDLGSRAELKDFFTYLTGRFSFLTSPVADEEATCSLLPSVCPVCKQSQVNRFNPRVAYLQGIGSLNKEMWRKIEETAKDGVGWTFSHSCHVHTCMAPDHYAIET